MSPRMSSTLQAETRGDSFTGLGKRPFAIPAHQADRLTGMTPLGATICGKRTKPASGKMAADFEEVFWVRTIKSPDCWPWLEQKILVVAATPLSSRSFVRVLREIIFGDFSKMLRKDEAQKNFRLF